MLSAVANTGFHHVGCCGKKRKLHYRKTWGVVLLLRRTLINLFFTFPETLSGGDFRILTSLLLALFTTALPILKPFVIRSENTNETLTLQALTFVRLISPASDLDAQSCGFVTFVLRN